MIIGIGTDLCEIVRIGDALERQGRKFIDRICTARELTLAASCPDIVRFCAGRFAAKEACAKALGTGINGRVKWHNIEILVDSEGILFLQLSGSALRRARRGISKREIKAHLSIAHEGDVASAFVIIEAIARF